MPALFLVLARGDEPCGRHLSQCTLVVIWWQEIVDRLLDITADTVDGSDITLDRISDRFLDVNKIVVEAVSGGLETFDVAGDYPSHVCLQRAQSAGGVRSDSM